jgi:hypothetical protein
VASDVIYLLFTDLDRQDKAQKLVEVELANAEEFEQAKGGWVLGKQVHLEEVEQGQRVSRPSQVTAVTHEYQTIL